MTTTKHLPRMVIFAATALVAFTTPALAQSDSMRISPNGDVGIGTTSPSASLHVQRDGTAKLLVENVMPAGAAALFELRNNGNPFFIFTDTSLARSYSFAMGATGHFIISNQQQAGVQYRFNPTGTLTLNNLVETSGRQFKENVVPLESGQILRQLEELSLSSWNYKVDPDRVRHLGPMAEDFYAAFGLGRDDQHLSPRDLAAVALAAVQGVNEVVQGVNEVVQERDTQIAGIEQRIAELEALVRTLAERE